MQRCCLKMMLLSLPPNIIVHVKNVVSLFSCPSTSSQKVRKCGGHKLLPNTCDFLPLLLRSYPSLQRCCWKLMLLSLHPNIIVCSPPPPLAHEKYESVAAIKFYQILVPLLLPSCPSLQICCWKLMLLSLHPNIIICSPPPLLAHKKYESVAAINFYQILVNFYHCFSGVAQVCKDAAGK